MCMLLGINASQRYNIEPVLKEFLQHSTQHKDGWGLGLYGGGKAHVYKEPVEALASDYARSIWSITTDLAIAHIRKATKGEIAYTNTHPFTRTIESKDWIFAHNGSVDEMAFKGLNLDVDGSTDSERVFAFITDSIAEKGNLREVVADIEAKIETISFYGKANLLFTDGENMFVHSNMPGTLYSYENSGLACFSTAPLRKVKVYTRWKQVPLNRLLVYRNGELIYTGHKHCNNYSNKYYALTKRYLEI